MECEIAASRNGICLHSRSRVNSLVNIDTHGGRYGTAELKVELEMGLAFCPSSGLINMNRSCPAG